MPALWADVLNSMDAVLAPSSFIAEAVTSCLRDDSGTRVLRYPQAVRPPAEVVGDRKRWLGERSGTFAVLFSFDAGSEIERKNPAAVIRAFTSAFADTRDATLILKVARSQHAAGPQWQAIQTAVANDPRVLLVTDMLDRREMWNLFASVDVYLSLHRSEGLGLGMMEAMSLGKPVVATGWSGNMDFTDDSNSLLVPFFLRPMEGATNAAYLGSAGVKWAEPDTGIAAEALRELADSPERRARLGEMARRRMQEMVREQEESRVLEELVELARDVVGTAEHRSRCRRAYAASATNYPGYQGRPSGLVRVKRLVVRGMRAVHLKAPAPAEELPRLLH